MISCCSQSENVEMCLFEDTKLLCLTWICAGVLTFTFTCRYGMMCKCWALDPGSRPSFSELVSFTCNQLTDREEKVGCFHSSTLPYPFISF